MEAIRIFLLDLNVQSGLGSTLQGILKSSAKPRIALQEKPIKIRPSLSFQEISRSISQFNPHLIFLILPEQSPKQLGEFIRTVCASSDLPVIAVIEADEPEHMIELLRMGIIDFITPPFRKIDVLPRVWRLLERRIPEETLVDSLKKKLGLQQMVGQDPAFLTEINKIPFVATCDASVLILGETGTGKELCGRAIHYLSPRAGKPFIPVNCGAIPTELVENELFGHMKGAFTGASQAYPGLIHEANGGTLFLDEIDCLPLQAQVKLLRFLQDKEYRQLGSTKIHYADVRVIVASNIDLAKAIAEGKFRQDLYYRLNIIPLYLPLLHDRKVDIPLLARHFLDKYASEFHKPVRDFTAEAMQKLMIYEWPGNVRELENVIERAIIFSSQPLIQPADIQIAQPEPLAPESFRTAKAKAVEQFERKYIQSLLLANQGNITRAAQAAAKNRRAFWELIRKYKIDVRGCKLGSP
jgi:two-component system response regulator GlrR